MKYKELKKYLQDLEKAHDIYGKHEEGLCVCGKSNKGYITKTEFKRLLKYHKGVEPRNLLRYLVEKHYDFETQVLRFITSEPRIDSKVLKMFKVSDIKYIFKEYISEFMLEEICEINPQYINVFYKRFNISEIKYLIEKYFEYFKDKDFYIKNYKISSFHHLDKIIYSLPNEKIKLIQLNKRQSEKLSLNECNTIEKAEKMCYFLETHDEAPIPIDERCSIETFEWLLKNQYYGLAFLINKQLTISYLLEKYQGLPKFKRKLDKQIFKKVRFEKPKFINLAKHLVLCKGDIYEIWEEI